MRGARATTPDSGLDISTWALDALARMTELPHVHRAGLAITEGGGRRLRFTASDRRNADDAWCHVDAYDDVPLNTVVRSGEPVLGGLDELAGNYREFVAHQGRTPTAALAAVPIMASGQVLGGYVVFFDAAQAFDDEQVRGLTRLGVETGEALRRVQGSTERPDVPFAEEPVAADALVTHHDVPPDPSAVSGARRFLRRTLEGWGVDDDTADTAVLCLSELVTNAVIHTEAGCAVRAVLDDDVLTVAVRDTGRDDAARDEAHEDPLRVHGRGLQLVHALVARWGSDLDTSGTTVWFVLEVS